MRHLPVIGARKHTESLRRLPKREIERGWVEYPLTEHPAAGHGRPATWSECCDRGLGIDGPCPYVSCPQHLYLEVLPSGSITYRFPDREVDEIGETCALAAAAIGGLTLDAVGERLNLSRERVRQLEESALAKMHADLAAWGER